MRSWRKVCASSNVVFFGLDLLVRSEYSSVFFFFSSPKIFRLFSYHIKIHLTESRVLIQRLVLLVTATWIDRYFAGWTPDVYLCLSAVSSHQELEALCVKAQMLGLDLLKS